MLLVLLFSSELLNRVDLSVSVGQRGEFVGCLSLWVVGLCVLGCRFMVCMHVQGCLTCIVICSKVLVVGVDVGDCCACMGG